jgi:hypothetical protein
MSQTFTVPSTSPVARYLFWASTAIIILPAENYKYFFMQDWLIFKAIFNNIQFCKFSLWSLHTILSIFPLIFTHNIIYLPFDLYIQYYLSSLWSLHTILSIFPLIFTHIIIYLPFDLYTQYYLSSLWSLHTILSIFPLIFTHNIIYLPFDLYTQYYLSSLWSLHIILSIFPLIFTHNIIYLPFDLYTQYYLSVSDKTRYIKGVMKIDEFGFLVYNAAVNNISVIVSFIGGGNWSARRKPLTCRKSLINFIT